VVLDSIIIAACSVCDAHKLRSGNFHIENIEVI
jgi:hypothetical protein